MVNSPLLFPFSLHIGYSFPGALRQQVDPFGCSEKGRSTCSFDPKRSKRQQVHSRSPRPTGCSTEALPVPFLSPASSVGAGAKTFVPI
jgi:hypothetical protein